MFPTNQTEQPSGRSDRQDEKPLTVWLPKPMHRKLKVKAAEKGLSMKECVRRELAKLLDENLS